MNSVLLSRCNSKTIIVSLNKRNINGRIFIKTHHCDSNEDPMHQPLSNKSANSSSLTSDDTPNELPEKEEYQIELRKDTNGLGITIAGYVCEKGKMHSLLTCL